MDASCLQEHELTDDSVIADYVWVVPTGSRGYGWSMHSKTRVTTRPFRPWSYDGSSTHELPVKQSEMMLEPVQYFYHPWRDGYLVFCQTKLPNGTPAPGNTLAALQDQSCYAFFSFEQEYYLIKRGEKPAMVDGHYCNVGAAAQHGAGVQRVIVEEHMQACIKAKISYSGYNAEVCTNQWEYQIGPVIGMFAGCHLWMSRYLLLLIAEKHGYDVWFDPKPGATKKLVDPLDNLSELRKQAVASGCHVNFSTMRTMDPESGRLEIERIIVSMAIAHTRDIKHYGIGNKHRLSGKKETSSYNNFTYGIGDRTASVRIPTEVHRKGYGYIEDRRPAANCDPFLVIACLLPHFTHPDDGKEVAAVDTVEDTDADIDVAVDTDADAAVEVTDTVADTDAADEVADSPVEEQDSPVTNEDSDCVSDV